jgi:hypothetical protein
MSELKPILQWVTISDVDGKAEVTHQFDEDGNQKNISHMLELGEKNKLNVLIGVPVDQRVGKDSPVGNPFIAIDMKTGLMNINGTNWNFFPRDIEPSIVNLRPIWYHSVKKDYDLHKMVQLSEKISLYKIGWQFTHEGKNYQRIIFFDTQTGIFSMKKKR